MGSRSKNWWKWDFFYPPVNIWFLILPKKEKKYFEIILKVIGVQHLKGHPRKLNLPDLAISSPKFSRLGVKKGQNRNFRFFPDFGPKTLLIPKNELWIAIIKEKNICGVINITFSPRFQWNVVKTQIRKNASFEHRSID